MLLNILYYSATLIPTYQLACNIMNRLNVPYLLFKFMRSAGAQWLSTQEVPVVRASLKVLEHGLPDMTEKLCDRDLSKAATNKHLNLQLV